MANGREPGDLIVRHACDHPICCNLAILRLARLSTIPET
jgi:hypothetical protein